MTKAIAKNKLTADEAAELKRLETTIDAGMQTFRDVGLALSIVIDKRLYREKYSSFNEYLEDRWKISRVQGYRLIEAAEVIKSLPAECNQLVTSESQARELSKAKPADRPAVIEAAAKSGKVTAKAIKAEVQKLNPKPAKVPEPEQPKKPLWLGYVNKWGRLVVKPHDMAEQLDAMNSPSVYFVIAGIEAENQVEAELIAQDRIAKEQVITTYAGAASIKDKPISGEAQPAKINTPKPEGSNGKGGEVRETPLKAERPADPSVEVEGYIKFIEDRANAPQEPEQESDLAGIIRSLKSVVEALEEVEAGMLPGDELPDFNQLGNECHIAGRHLQRIAKEIK